MDMEKVIIIEFPLRGEWLAPNTPGAKIPSHGTNRLGTRFAYDFIQVDWQRKGWPSYRVHWLRYLLFGVPLHKCYGYGQEVYAPCDGTIIEVKDGYKERSRSHLLSDMFVALKNAHFFNPETDNLQLVAGNYIIMKCSDGIYAGLVHLQKDSITVSVGDAVKRGEIIGKVGHSGNSMSPHLHFQLMDSSDMVYANGLPCAFAQYEVFDNGNWREVNNSVPTDKERIRFHGKKGYRSNML